MRVNHDSELNMKSGFKYFVIASSLPATLWPLLGLAVSNTRAGGDLDFMYVGLIVPLLFGLCNSISSFVKFERNKRNMLLTGLLIGLVMASVGSYFGIPERVYGLTGNIRFLVLIGGPIFYGMVWRFVVYPLEQAFIKP